MFKKPVYFLLVFIYLLGGCSGGIMGHTDRLISSNSPVDYAEIPGSEPTATAHPGNEALDRLTGDQVATLTSLQKVDEFPLYSMSFVGQYDEAHSTMDAGAVLLPQDAIPSYSDWGCSLFTSLVDSENLLFGRNFDWRYSPALLLFTDPPDGYASFSMVDIAYLVDDEVVDRLEELPINEREVLLQTPYWPFDGMNEHGLAIGMAAVDNSPMPHDPQKETIDSLMIIREMLDHARDVGEALEIMKRYNISWEGGPALHYLLADPSGQALLVEFVDGEMRVLPNHQPWHLATNFLLSMDPNNKQANCWRYEIIEDTLVEFNGKLTAKQAIDLLGEVSWESATHATQWSIVYDMNSAEAHVAVGRNYERTHSFSMKDSGQ